MVDQELEPGRYALTVCAPGYSLSPAEEVMVSTARPELTMDLSLASTASLHYRVQGEDGAHLPVKITVVNDGPAGALLLLAVVGCTNHPDAPASSAPGP